MIRTFEKLGPLGPSLGLFTVCLLVFFLNRIALGFYFSDSILNTAGFLHYLPLGLRMDTIILSLFFSLPILITLLSPATFFSRLRTVISGYFLLVITFFVFMEIVSWPFLDQFSSRPDQQFFQYLTHPKEVISMLWGEYKLLLTLSVIFIYYFIKIGWRAINLLLRRAGEWSYTKQLIVLPVVIILFTIGARSGTGQANANPGIAAFSNNHLLNQLAQNSSYSLTYSVYLSRRSTLNSNKLFGNMAQDDVISRIKKYMDVPAENFTNPAIPTLHIQKPTIVRNRPLNLVIIVMEGFGSDHIGTLGGDINGITLTPNFDELSKEGVLFTNIHSIGTRTSRGIEAMVSGYLPTAKGSSILKMPLAQTNFFTIASLLKRFDYQTSFIYSGESHFDNMAAFFIGNGFDQIIDEADFINPNYYGTWGVSDEDTFVKANTIFRKQQGKNFLSVVLTISNHPPFDFPDGKISLYEQPAHTPNNATKYADYALGKFFKLAKKEEYFNDTVFLITADHPLLIRADSLVPVNKYKIPALIIAPGLKPARISTLGSQIDLLPTALDLLGMETEHPMIGRNLFMNIPQIKNKQVSVYTTSVAFRTADKVSIYQPQTAAKTFRLESGGGKNTFIQIKDDPEFSMDALAHILFPGLAYRQQIYRQQ